MVNFREREKDWQAAIAETTRITLTQGDFFSFPAALWKVDEKFVGGDPSVTQRLAEAKESRIKMSRCSFNLPPVPSSVVSQPWNYFRCSEFFMVMLCFECHVSLPSSTYLPQSFLGRLKRYYCHMIKSDTCWNLSHCSIVVIFNVLHLINVSCCNNSWNKTKIQGEHNTGLPEEPETIN